MDQLVATTDDGVSCPACQARQEWSDTCRRCKCDLSLLRRGSEACRQCRRRCLALLRAGRYREALAAAGRGYTLCPDPRAARLLAVCHLLNGRWPQAMALAQLWD